MMIDKNQFSVLNNYGFLFITGPDSQKFLQGQLTCDINLLKQDKPLLGAHCNPKGRMISLFKLYLYQDGILLQAPKSMLELTQKNLKKYSVFFKVSINLRDDLSLLGVKGDSILLSKTALITSVPGERLEIIDTLEQLNLLQAGPLSDHQSISETEWKYIDCGFGIPHLAPETSEVFIPQMLSLEKWGGISFKKGCYTGQEIIARTEYRGQLKRHLYLLEIPADIALKPGLPLTIAKDLEKHELGTVVERAFSQTESNLRVLIVLHDNELDHFSSAVLAENQPVTLCSLV